MGGSESFMPPHPPTLQKSAGKPSETEKNRPAPLAFMCLLHHAPGRPSRKLAATPSSSPTSSRLPSSAHSPSRAALEPGCGSATRHHAPPSRPQLWRASVNACVPVGPAGPVGERALPAFAAASSDASRGRHGAARSRCSVSPSPRQRKEAQALDRQRGGQSEVTLQSTSRSITEAEHET